MICPECNGRGESIYFVETHRDKNSVVVEKRKGICRTCNGSGEKQPTNADRIRAMSDEELAEFLWGFEIEEIARATEYALERRKITEWLKQPAEVE